MINHTIQLSLFGNPLNCDCWLGSILDFSSIIINDLHLLQCHSHLIVNISRNDFLCSYSRHCASDCSCCDFEACDCHFVCPSECSCAHDIHWSRHLVQCPNANLSNIHLLLPQTITQLDYQDNQIEQIKPFVFVGKTSLTKLNLARNRLRQLANDTFCAASNLREINLSDNPDLMNIPSIIEDSFRCLKYLQNIIFSKDQMKKEQQISQEWMILSNSNDEIVRLTRAEPKPSGLITQKRNLMTMKNLFICFSIPYDEHYSYCSVICHQSSDTKFSHSTCDNATVVSTRMYDIYTSHTRNDYSTCSISST